MKWFVSMCVKVEEEKEVTTQISRFRLSFFGCVLAIEYVSGVFLCFTVIDYLPSNSCVNCVK